MALGDLFSIPCSPTAFLWYHTLTILSIEWKLVILGCEHCMVLTSTASKQIILCPLYVGSPTVNHATWGPLSYELGYGLFLNTYFYDQSALTVHLSLLFHVVFQSVIYNHIDLITRTTAVLFFTPFYSF